MRKWRKSNGLTLEQAASRVPTSRQVWSDWERWRRKPNDENMPRVRDVTGGEVTADHFYPQRAA